MSDDSSLAHEERAVKFLTVVWGKKYIDRFCSISLPSFLASGNIPALAKATQLEVVIMTREADVYLFEENASFRALKRICPVRFIDIDDLITDGFYGVTLTLAYARPIIACGEAMLDTHFVFMNADFILADGSMSSLVRHIEDSRSIVLGPSYRAISEELEDDLESLVDRDGILTIASRDAVRMSIKHPHITTVAKTFGQNAISSSHPNQLFWVVDNNTILGRYFLSFMLCLKPEKVIEKINCYCDYALIPELCPSGDEVMMGDSDQFFMLELQGRDQEVELLQLGSMGSKEIADSLMQWATPEHLRASEYEVIFHAGEIPAAIDVVRKESDRVVNEVKSHLDGSRSHLDHHYWLAGVSGWQDARKAQGQSFNPKELASPPFSLATQVYLKVHKAIARLRSVAFQYSPAGKIDKFKQGLLDVLRESEEDQRILIVGDSCDAKEYRLGKAIYYIESDKTVSSMKVGDGFDQILCLSGDGSSDCSEAIHDLLGMLNDSGSLHIYSDIYDGSYSTRACGRFFARIMNFVDLSSYHVCLDSAGALPLYLIRHPSLLAMWRAGSGWRIIMAPMLAMFSLTERLLQPKGATWQRKVPMAYWLKISPF